VTASTNFTGRQQRPGLSVRPLELERETVLVLRGEFDLTGVELFREAVAHVNPDHSMVLDMHDLAFLDSSGLGAFVELAERAKEQGWSLVLAAPQPQVAVVLEISGLAERLTVVGSPSSG
jgi:anti-sigma B factor antagonist